MRLGPFEPPVSWQGRLLLDHVRTDRSGASAGCWPDLRDGESAPIAAGKQRLEQRIPRKVPRLCSSHYSVVNRGRLAESALLRIAEYDCSIYIYS